MFAQANSEHCRHKIFNATFDRRRRTPQDDTLFGMIRRTTEASPAACSSAYSDNAAVIEGPEGGALLRGDRRRVRAASASACTS